MTRIIANLFGVMIVWTFLFMGIARGSEVLVATATVSALKDEQPSEESQSARQRENWSVRYVITVANAGKRDIRIPTAGFVQPTEYGTKLTKKTLLWQLDQDGKGRTIIIPEVDLRPVILRPGEVALIRTSDVEHDISRLDHVEVTLRVTDAFAHRFGFWTGELKITDIPIYREPVNSSDVRKPIVSEHAIRPPDQRQ